MVIDMLVLFMIPVIVGIAVIANVILEYREEKHALESELEMKRYIAAQILMSRGKGETHNAI